MKASRQIGGALRESLSEEIERVRAATSPFAIRHPACPDFLVWKPTGLTIEKENYCRGFEGLRNLISRHQSTQSMKKQHGWKPLMTDCL
jgi:hypothetical protein